MIARRTALGGAMAAAAAAAWPALGREMPGGTYAWATLDRGSGQLGGANADVRMPMCSTFKWLLAACVLARVDRGVERLDRRVGFGPADLIDASPTVKAALGGAPRATLTVAALCEAAVTLSDNAAANLLLPSIGGPAGLTDWLRRIGDRVTRLDRTEPTLNYVPVDDPRDTTTTAAMLRELDRLLYGPVLSAGSRRQLWDWLLGCRTGDTRLRAGLPPGWRIAHKTGTSISDPGPGVRNAAGDVGVLLPPRGAPILVTAYAVGFTVSPAEVDRWFADIAGQSVRNAAR